MKCLECGGEMIRSLDPIQTVFKGDELQIESVEHWKCEQCGELEYESADLDVLDGAENEAYRKLHNLLSPKEIKAIRKRYGLTQAQFEELLGVATPTVSRWETGSVIQTKVADNLMRAIREFPEVPQALAKNAGIALPETGIQIASDREANLVRFPWVKKTSDGSAFASGKSSYASLTGRQERFRTTGPAQSRLGNHSYLQPQDEAA